MLADPLYLYPKSRRRFSMISCSARSRASASSRTISRSTNSRSDSRLWKRPPNRCSAAAQASSGRLTFLLALIDYLKLLARARQRNSAVLEIKQRREVAPFAGDSQLRVKVPVLVDSKQTVPDLAFF